MFHQVKEPDLDTTTSIGYNTSVRKEYVEDFYFWLYATALVLGTIGGIADKLFRES